MRGRAGSGELALSMKEMQRRDSPTSPHQPQPHRPRRAFFSAARIFRTWLSRLNFEAIILARRTCRKKGWGTGHVQATFRAVFGVEAGREAEAGAALHALRQDLERSLLPLSKQPIGAVNS